MPKLGEIIVYHNDFSVYRTGDGTIGCGHMRTVQSRKRRSVLFVVARAGFQIRRLHRITLLLRAGRNEQTHPSVLSAIPRIGLWILFQAVGCALNVLGFGESMAGLVGLDSAWAQRGFASAAVVLLSVINVAGVKWVVKLQFVLLLILLLAGVDFMVGSFTHTNIGESIRNVLAL